MSKLGKFTIVLVVLWAITGSVLAGYDTVAARRWRHQVEVAQAEIKRTRDLADTVATGEDQAGLRRKLAQLSADLDRRVQAVETVSADRDVLRTLLGRVETGVTGLTLCATAVDGPLSRAATPPTTTTTTVRPTTSTDPTANSTSTTTSTSTTVPILVDPSAATARAQCQEAASQAAAILDDVRSALVAPTPRPAGTTTSTTGPRL